jgi:hypothetical protein
VPLKRPCIEGCGSLTTATRCTPCQSARNKARHASRPHYQGDYKARAKQVRDAANADPTTRCWRCNQTAGTPANPWTAGHLIDGDPQSPLAPECRRCNTSAGARLGNARRKRWA